METKTIETPVEKHQVVLKSFITGEEEDKIKKIWRNVEVTMENSKGGVVQKTASFNMANRIEIAEKIAVEIIIVSIDEKTENVYGELKKMNSKDCNFVKKEIDKITEDEDFLEE
ncbi:hypothetical protein KAU51_04270 [Candidatus Parcubacteria bacterium]|nr:hypothetical protein [Candidatus Parcubacteria bacterium]